MGLQGLLRSRLVPRAVPGCSRMALQAARGAVALLEPIPSLMETPLRFLNCQSTCLTPGAAGDGVYSTAFQATGGQVLLQTGNLLLLLLLLQPQEQHRSLCAAAAASAPAPQPSFSPGEPTNRSLLCLLEALQGFQPSSCSYLSPRAPGEVGSVCWRPQCCCCCCWNCSFSRVRTGKLLPTCERGKN